jgi:hypothetical protein
LTCKGTGVRRLVEVACARGGGVSWKRDVPLHTKCLLTRLAEPVAAAAANQVPEVLLVRVPLLAKLLQPATHAK